MGRRAPWLLVLFCAVVSAHPTDFRELVRRAAPSVVSIETTRTTDPHSLADSDEHRNIPDFLERFFGGEEAPELFETQSVGSGFILSSDGLVVTNHHVVEGADEIIVRLSDRREFQGRVLGLDPPTDLALLRIDADSLPTASIGASEGVAVGDWVAAIGSPFNFENSVTAGILSARGRIFPRQQYVPFLQTDVPINRGNSGGPLLDLSGNVIGVNSQIFSESGTYMGLSFSIPIEIVMDVVGKLEHAGAVDRGLLGVGIEAVSQELGTALGLPGTQGAILNSISPDSAAERAGLEVWDIITAVDGRPVTRYADLPPMIGVLSPGTATTLTILRSGDERLVEVVIGSAGTVAAASEEEVAPPMDDAPPRPPRPPRLGLELEEEDDGLRIRSIEWPPAERASLRPGDLITSVNGTPVASLDAFDTIMATVSDGPVALHVLGRRGIGQFVVISDGDTR